MKTTTIQIRLNEELKARIKAEAERRRRSVSDTIRIILEDYLNEKEIQNDRIEALKVSTMDMLQKGQKP